MFGVCHPSVANELQCGNSFKMSFFLILDDRLDIVTGIMFVNREREVSFPFPLLATSPHRSSTGVVAMSDEFSGRCCPLLRECCCPLLREQASVIAIINHIIILTRPGSRWFPPAWEGRPG